MTVIHLVTSVDKINFGIWNAAIFGSHYLSEQYGVTSLLWVTSSGHSDGLKPSIECSFLKKESVSKKGFLHHLKASFPNKQEVVIVSHGCWRLPTKLGYWAKQNGYAWVYVPHGMLEPWSMQHRKWKKLVYFNLIEKRMGKSASIIRAVGESEGKNLQTLLQKPISIVENGVVIPNYFAKNTSTLVFLFMARLHFKKGITPLVKAWSEAMKNEPNVKLLIAGPDEGELALLQPYLTGNIEYLGAVYGEAKVKLLQKSSYYILPSLSEGFPVSVLEAMGYGCVPIISEGCNFPAVFEQNLGYKLSPDTNEISSVLNAIKSKSFDHELSKKNHDFIATNYSEKCIGDQLMSMYQKIIAN